MRISDAIVPELDHEAGNTRKTLERIPADKFTWKPHTKSMSMGQLAIHVATIPEWVGAILGGDGMDFASPEVAGYKPPDLKTTKELLDRFDKTTADARAAITAADDEHLMKPWTLRAGPQVFFTLPRIAVIRSMVMSHTIHHRAQLGVYLRLNEIPVPSVYGPSADETGMGATAG
ncbi:MAG: DinB family protein [Acidobacteriia bacterium]|nr:DinB family protein [Terriglobia bacterium]